MSTTYIPVPFYPEDENALYRYPIQTSHEFEGLTVAIETVLNQYLRGELFKGMRLLRRKLVILLVGYKIELMEQVKAKLGADMLQPTNRGTAGDIWFMTFVRPEGDPADHTQ